MKIKIQTSKAPPSKTTPFSQGIMSGDLIFTSGQIHLTSEGKPAQN